MRTWARTLGILLLAAAIGGALGGCGKKGQLIPPEGATYPQQYPRE